MRMNTRYFDSLLCGLPCYLCIYWGIFDVLVEVITPVLIIFLYNFALFLRVVSIKIRLLAVVWEITGDVNEKWLFN